METSKKALILAIVIMCGCTIPSSITHKCSGGRRIKVEHHHEVSLFGIPFIASKENITGEGECHGTRELDIDIGPKED